MAALELKDQFPKGVTLDADETHRINRVELALLLHKLPSEIDAQPIQDIEDVIAVKTMRDILAERRNR